MNKQSIFTHFSKIIDNMLDNSLFFETYYQCPYPLDTIIGSIDDAAVPENISIHFGISRGCIVDEDYDYVVKFDIGSDNFGDSLCQREMDIFRAARARELDSYFTEPIYLGSYCRTIQFYNYEEIERNMENWFDYDPEDFDKKFMKDEENFGPICPIVIEIPLYAYARANQYKYAMFSDNEAEHYKSEARSISSPLKRRHLQIAMEFVFRYGMEQYEKLSDFLEEYDVNDLHYGNIGNVNGSLVIYDYAGWHSYSDDEDEYSND